MSGVAGAALAACLVALVVAAGAIVVALANWRALQLAASRLTQSERAALEAKSRAEDAEKALTEIRMKRSLAVSKGNRTRAELERARILETTEAVRAAVRRKRQPQGSLPL
jgi:hypothetical protein